MLRKGLSSPVGQETVCKKWSCLPWPGARKMLSPLSWLPGFLESGLLSIYSNCSFRLVHCLKLFDDHHLSLIKRKVQNTRYTSFHSVSVFLAVAMCGEIVSILLKFLLTLWDSVSSSKILLLEEIISLILIISGIPYTELPIQEKRQTWRKL